MPGQAERKYTYAGQEIQVTPFYAFESQSAVQLKNDRGQQAKAPRMAHLVIFFKCQLPMPCSNI